MGLSIVMGIPQQYGLFLLSQNPIKKWMIWGYPHDEMETPT